MLIAMACVVLLYCDDPACEQLGTSMPRVAAESEMSSSDAVWSSAPLQAASSTAGSTVLKVTARDFRNVFLVRIIVVFSFASLFWVVFSSERRRPRRCAESGRPPRGAVQSSLGSAAPQAVVGSWERRPRPPLEAERAQ